MQRITQKDLQGAVNLLNHVASTPTTQYRAEPVLAGSGATRLIANIGNYHLDGAYGGWALHQMANEGGGIRDIFNMGHMPARELYNLIHAYRKGIESQQGANHE